MSLDDISVDPFELEVRFGNCAKCPEIQDFMSASVAFNEVATIKGVVAMDPESEEFIPRITHALFSGTDGIPRDPQTGEELLTDEDIMKSYRRLMGTIIEADHAMSESSEDICEAMTQGCEGPLKMRAKKAGRIITVTVCNSPFLPDGENDPHIESVVVIRSAEK